MSLTAVCFLLGYLIGCSLAVFRAPVYGLVTYILVLYLHPPSRWWGETLPDIRWSFVAGALTLVGIFLSRKTQKNYSLQLFKQPAFLGLSAFLAWIYLQSLWALDSQAHSDLLGYFTKYLFIVAMIYWIVHQEQELRLILWAHVLGCFYFGWIAFTTYQGGRFEGFGGPGIGDANTSAIQLVTGIYAAAALLLASQPRGFFTLLLIVPIITNALVATISRSGFIAAGIAGIIFTALSTNVYRKKVHVYALIGAIGFVVLTGATYWERMTTLKYAGEEVQGVDTGGGRLEIILAQWEMFKENPLGCGHRCTVVLSPNYIDERFLTTGGGEKARASHNTFMTLLVEQGVPGALFYLLFLAWVCRTVLRLRNTLNDVHGLISALVPAIGSTLAAIFVADMFVDYLKLEVRMWFVGLLLAVSNLASQYGRANYNVWQTAQAARQPSSP